MRPTWDETWMEVVRAMERRSTCVRRSVGCVIVSYDNKILSSGYNGVASGQPHCNEGHLCTAVNVPSGTDLDGCSAVHAEINALIACENVRRAKTVYVSASPCVSCVKAIMPTSIRRIVFAEEYPQPRAKELWLAMNSGNRSERMWVHLK